MHVYIWIVILVLFLATVVAAYFASRTWHWAQVLVAVGIFVAAIGYFVLAAETLRIHAVLRSQANDLEERLATVSAEVEALRRGTRDAQLIRRLAADDVAVPTDADRMPSVGDLEHRLHLHTRLRGSVWRDVIPAGFDAENGTLLVTLPNAEGAAAAVEPETILFVFEQGEPAPADADPSAGSQYLGEFRVVEVAGPDVTLQAVDRLDQFETDRVASAEGPLVLHETMPVDQYELFAGLSEEQLQQMLPAESVEEYLRHGGEARSDDPPLRRVEVDEQGNPVGPDYEGPTTERYFRRLRDYAVEFSELAQQRALMLADLAATVQDNQRLATALENSRQLGMFREAQIGRFEHDLAGVRRDRQLIEEHLSTLEQQLTNARQLVRDAIAASASLADELADIQRRLEQQINERTSEAAGPLALADGESR